MHLPEQPVVAGILRRLGRGRGERMDLDQREMPENDQQCRAIPVLQKADDRIGGGAVGTLVVAIFNERDGSLSAVQTIASLTQRSMSKEYRADRIVKHVIRHSPRSLPRPAHLKVDLKTQEVRADYVEHFKPEVWDCILKTYNVCDELLHEFKLDFLPDASSNPTDRLRDGLRALRSALTVHMVMTDTFVIACVFGEEREVAPTTMLAGPGNFGTKRWDT